MVGDARGRGRIRDPNYVSDGRQGRPMRNKNGHSLTDSGFRSQKKKRGDEREMKVGERWRGSRVHVHHQSRGDGRREESCEETKTAGKKQTKHQLVCLMISPESRPGRPELRRKAKSSILIDNLNLETRRPALHARRRSAGRMKIFRESLGSICFC